MIEMILKAFEKFEEVEAMMLGGSRATGKFDNKSDYDIYVYLNKHLSEEKRKVVLDQFCSHMEYSNSFWELEDDGIMNNGIELELIYRDYNFFDNIINNMKKKNVGNGYSTCFYDNLMNSVLIFDKSGKIAELQANNKGLINDDFVQVIIDKNYPLIYKASPALYGQIKKAMERNDINSINHRLTEYFAIYYDILFALNKTSHPGEKRLVELASALQYIPDNFMGKVNAVFKNCYENHVVALKNLDYLSKDIEKLIRTLGYDI